MPESSSTEGVAVRQHLYCTTFIRSRGREARLAAALCVFEKLEVRYPTHTRAQSRQQMDVLSSQEFTTVRRTGILIDKR